MFGFAPVYIIYRALERILDFCHHWYVDGSKYFLNGFMNYLEERDKSFALRVTVKHFFEPLYKDYTVIGRILGVIFRSIRVALALGFYAISGIIFLAAYLAWVATPLFLLIYASSFFVRK